MDHDEMRKAMERAQEAKPIIVECVDYTSIYRHVYGSLKSDQVPHEELHVAALQITDALWTLHLYVNDRDSQLEESADAIVATALKLFQ